MVCAPVRSIISPYRRTTHALSPTERMEITLITDEIHTFKFPRITAQTPIQIAATKHIHVHVHLPGIFV